MTDAGPPVKDNTTDRVWRRCLDFIDAHPRVGWYVAAISTLNFLMEVFLVVHH